MTPPIVPLADEHCPYCGSAIAPPDAMWRPTDERRILPIGAEFHRIVGTMPAGGLFPRMEHVDLRIIADQNYVTERMWVRTWAEREWRRA